ncbi:MAG: hypothetical protein GYA58_11815 [Anaerolineaceae bacterium]|nr:hypothetical protein [Anaerolineaceae bacterium]
MLKERLRDLFKSYEPDIRLIVFEVGEFEQENISMKTPHFKEPIDAIVEKIARKRIKQADDKVFEE